MGESKKKRKKINKKSLLNMRGEKRAKEPKVTKAPSCFLGFFSREIKITDWGVYSPAAWSAKPWHCLWTQRANWPIAEQG